MTTLEKRRMGTVYDQDAAVAKRYEDAYEMLTARSKLSRVHGLEAYCDDRGWC